MMATRPITVPYLPGTGYDSELTETRLRYLLQPYVSSCGTWIALLVTPTPGEIAIMNFRITAWPVWTRTGIMKKLLLLGGVLSECPLELRISSAGRPHAQPVTKEGTSSNATTAATVTESGENE